jgi:hypothetical protein
MSPREFDELAMADIHRLWEQIEREQRETQAEIDRMRTTARG